MKLDKTTSNVQTFMGSICSILIIFVVGSYAYQKTDVWLNKKDNDIMSATQDQYLSPGYVFDQAMGLNFAIAFTAYDNEKEDILDPSYGSLTFTTYEWGLDENGDTFIKFDEIPSHVCSREELGLEGDNSSFMPIIGTNVSTVNLHQKKFRCIDNEEMKVNGDYDSPEARLISMRLNRCVNTDTLTCKS